MKPPIAKIPKTTDWPALAERRLKAILKKARGFAELRGLGPFGEAPAWTVDVRLLGSPAMTRLNGQYRGKKYATDVLSFSSPTMFSRAGWLGELVLCLPVLKRQARELGHLPEQELDVLLAHGVLHLLGLDHERGPRHAAKMAKWERALLPKAAAGLIERTRVTPAARRARKTSK